MEPPQHVGLVLGLQEGGVHPGDLLQRLVDRIGAPHERMHAHGFDGHRAALLQSTFVCGSHVSMAACPSEAGGHLEVFGGPAGAPAISITPAHLNSNICSNSASRFRRSSVDDAWVAEVTLERG